MVECPIGKDRCIGIGDRVARMNPSFQIEKIISGGQTGVDRAALDAALELGVSCGGWCPKGRKAEDGPIHHRYPLRETASSSYSVRTLKNVKESDGTLILSGSNAVSSGTALTIKFAQERKKPYLVIVIRKREDLETSKNWIEAHRIRVLNVAGPRESEAPGIHNRAFQFLKELLMTMSLSRTT